MAGFRQRLGFRVSAAAARALGIAEDYCFGAEGPDSPPLFITGLPRGGTTLVCQAICHRFRVSYTSMLTNQLPACPAFATWLVRRRIQSYESNFRSDYGRSDSIGSPGESRIWNLWFDRYSPQSSLSEAHPHCQRVVRSFGQIERIGGAPVVTKNPRLSQWLHPMSELFPAARFLLVVRDPRAVGLSLLRRRYRRGRNPAKWYSVLPRGHETLQSRSPAGQVAGQIAGILRGLKEDIPAIGSNRFMTVTYEDFCAEPGTFLSRLAEWMEAAGSTWTTQHELPSAFEVSTRAGDGIPETADAELDEWLGEIDWNSLSLDTNLGSIP